MHRYDRRWSIPRKTQYKGIKPMILRGKQLMKRKEYCESSSVQEFIKWISYLIDKEDSFTHTYIIAKTKEKWECNSIYSAFENYMWPFFYIDSNGKRICGNSFWDSEKVLNKCSSQLKESLYLNDEEECFSACRQILEWGGVTNKNLDRIRGMKNRCSYFKSVINVLESDSDLEEYIYADIIMNSGFTKIYSLIVKDFIIYDSRVGATLGLLVKKYCEETNKDKIPEELRFAWGLKRQTLYGQTKSSENPRNPSNNIYKFPLLTNSKLHIDNNIRANWLLKEILNKTNSMFNYLDNSVTLRALEAALFMIGYEVRTYKSENMKDKKNEKCMIDISNIIKEKLENSEGKAEVSLLKANRSFCVELTNGGIVVDNLKNEPFLEWKVFEKAIELLEKEGGIALKGDAMGSKLGEPGLPLNSIEGYIAKEVYGKEVGDSVFRRISPIVNILIWAGVCKNGKGKLILK